MASRQEIEQALAFIDNPFGDPPSGYYSFTAYRNAHRYAYEPAKFFEEHTGITGVSQDYAFPDTPGYSKDEAKAVLQQAKGLHYIVRCKKGFLDGDVPPEYQHIPTEELEQQALDIMTPVLQELERCNPGMEELRYDKHAMDQTLHALSGVLSCFSVPDINYFINISLPARQPISASTIDEWTRLLRARAPDVADDRERKNELSRIFVRRGLGFKGMMEWVASPETMDKIERQLPHLPPLETLARYTVKDRNFPQL